MLFFYLLIGCSFAGIIYFFLKSKKQEDKKIMPATSPASHSLLADLGYDAKDNTVFQTTPLPSSASLDLKAGKDLWMVTLTAPLDRPFLGYELVQALIASNLRHGAMGLFHHYDTNSNILFSVAQATESGAFDLKKLSDLTCRGLIFFTPTDKEESVRTTLMATARTLENELGGHLNFTQMHEKVGQH